MKNLLRSFFLHFLLAGSIQAQPANLLCKANEETVFSFRLKNAKWVYVCKDNDNAYLVYRFGTNTKIELEYPPVLDSASWQKFSLRYYNRGGGKQNAAMSFAFLEFINNDVKYEVYQTWSSEDDKEECGVLVSVDKKDTDLKGLVKTKKGNLQNLSVTNIRIVE